MMSFKVDKKLAKVPLNHSSLQLVEEEEPDVITSDDTNEANLNSSKKTISNRNSSAVNDVGGSDGQRQA